MEQNRTTHMSEVRGIYEQLLPGRHSSKLRSYQVLIDKLQVAMEF